MTTSKRDPEALLFADDSGDMVGHLEVIDGGIDGSYADRVPYLEQLASSGDPYQRLLAVTILASWGSPTGLRLVARWAGDPDHVPWAGHSVTSDRLTGADDAFQMLSDAVRTSFWVDDREGLAALRSAALRSLLHVSGRAYVGRALAAALARDEAMARELSPDLHQAVAAGVELLARRAADVAAVPFHPGVQTVSLLGRLAAIDDRGAGSLAARLLATGAADAHVRRELALDLGAGTEHATEDVLRQLAHDPDVDVRDAATSSLLRRGAEDA